jgi:hypothetical protein
MVKKLVVFFSLVLVTACSAEEIIRYNQFSSKWEYGDSKDEIRYNQFEHQWEYAPANQKIRYNSFEHQWEYTD